MPRRLLDVRIAVLPTVEGEGVIMRLLDKTRTAPTLTEIGLSNEMQMALEEVIYRPSGAFLATGPTGSGKSTTLYAALTDVSRPEINVITIEDPVEYRLEDVYHARRRHAHALARRPGQGGRRYHDDRRAFAGGGLVTVSARAAARSGFGAPAG